MIFLPKEVKFSDHFETLADKIQAGGVLLRQILEDYGQLDVKASKLKDIEHEADSVANTIYRELHATFITPLDREDIFSLVTALDNILDMMESTATKMQLYRIKSPPLECLELASLLHRSIVLVNRAIHSMRHRERTSRPSCPPA